MCLDVYTRRVVFHTAGTVILKLKVNSAEKQLTEELSPFSSLGLWPSGLAAVVMF